jgi:hypothetical protein
MDKKGNRCRKKSKKFNFFSLFSRLEKNDNGIGFTYVLSNFRAPKTAATLALSTFQNFAKKILITRGEYSPIR